MADFNEYKGVWVFCEQRQGALMSTDFELVSEARKLADELGCEVTGLLLGDNVEGIAKELGGYGADKVMVCDSPLLKDYTTDAYAKVVCDMVNEYKPEVLLIGATNIGRDLGPRCAARLHTGLTADATHLDIDTAKYVEFLKESSTIDLSKQKFDYEDRNLKMTRPAFGGHLMATIICPRFRPCMATVRPGVMKKNAFDEAKANGTWGIEYTTCQKCGYHNWTRKGNVYVCDTCGNETTTVVSAKGVKGYVGSGAIAPVANKAAAPETRYANAKQAQAAADAREAAYAAAVAAFQKQIAANEAAYLAAIAK